MGPYPAVFLAVTRNLYVEPVVSVDLYVVVLWEVVSIV